MTERRLGRPDCEGLVYPADNGQSMITLGFLDLRGSGGLAQLKQSWSRGEGPMQFHGHLQSYLLGHQGQTLQTLQSLHPQSIFSSVQGSPGS